MPWHKKKKSVLAKAKKYTSAKAQSKQIASLARQVDVLKINDKKLSIPVHYHCGYSSRTDVARGSPLIVPLTAGPRSGQYSGNAITNNTPPDFLNWIKWGSFPGQAVNTQRGNLRLYSQYVDMQLTPGGEVDFCNHTIFVVSLRNDTDGMARQTYTRTGSMMSMTNDLDFTDNPDDDGNQVYLNPLLYRIHHRFEANTAGSLTEPISADTGTLIRSDAKNAGFNSWQFKLNYGGRALKATERSAEVQSINYDDIPPEYKYFIVAFSNNSISDLENPNLSVHSTITGRIF